MHMRNLSMFCQSYVEADGVSGMRIKHDLVLAGPLTEKCLAFTKYQDS